MKRKRTQRKQASARHKTTAVTRLKIDDWLTAISALIQQQRYELAIKACQHLLQHKKSSTQQKAEAYGYIG